MDVVYRSLLIWSLTLLSALTAHAQNLIDTMYTKVMESHVELVYSYSFRMSGVNNVGQGILSAQDDLWHVDGNGIQMWCDGSSMWVVDPSLKEVVIEPAVLEADYLSNPALLFTRMDDCFNVRMARSSADGDTMLYVLEPKHSGDIDYCNIEVFKDDASIKSATFAMTDGNLLNIEVSSMTFSPKRPHTSFRPQTSFDSSWIVTDLR
ncbi:MAG: outer membrane lipoprotein carrier protein LolA [Bacteroidales bacterium]|nr:outer membrane lipoprotein carrier protein LolA [Bacteroidales bacterium]